jgi:hypothetical protein
MAPPCLFVKLFGLHQGQTRDLGHGKRLCKGRATSPPTLFLNLYSLKLLFKVALKFGLGEKGRGLAPALVTTT